MDSEPTDHPEDTMQNPDPNPDPKDDQEIMLNDMWEKAIEVTIMKFPTYLCQCLSCFQK